MMNIGRGFARIYTNATTILVNDELFIWIGSGKIFGEIPVQLLFMVVVVIITGLILNKPNLEEIFMQSVITSKRQFIVGLIQKKLFFWCLHFRVYLRLVQDIERGKNIFRTI